MKLIRTQIMYVQWWLKLRKFLEIFMYSNFVCLQEMLRFTECNLLHIILKGIQYLLLVKQNSPQDIWVFQLPCLESESFVYEIRRQTQ